MTTLTRNAPQLRFGETQLEDAHLLERFLSHVEKTERCWLWTAYLLPNGYGRFSRNRRYTYAHRASYQFFIGPVPEGLQIDHTCRNRACVNPDHLEAVTCRVNLLRGETSPAENASKTACKRGHPFTPDNTYIERKGNGGMRHCRACRALDARRFRAKKAAIS